MDKMCVCIQGKKECMLLLILVVVKVVVKVVIKVVVVVVVSNVCVCKEKDDTKKAT